MVRSEQTAKGQMFIANTMEGRQTPHMGLHIRLLIPMCQHTYSTPDSAAAMAANRKMDRYAGFKKYNAVLAWLYGTYP
jgi:hypothetical protein